MTRLFKMWPVLFLIIASIFSCHNPGEPGSDGESGIILITFDLSEDFLGKPIEPGISMEIAEFSINGAGPDGASFVRSHIMQDTVIQAALVPGYWTIQVMGYNGNGILIGSGEFTEEIIAGELTNASVVVRPLQGNGALQIDVSWPDGVLSTPDMRGSYNLVNGSEQALSFEIAGDSLSATSLDSLEAGSYLVTLQLMDNNTVAWGKTEAAFIAAGSLSGRSYILTQEVNQGGLSVSIQDSIIQPIDIALTGAVDTLYEGGTMTVTADPEELVDSFQWYLDGDLLSGETDATITFGETIPLGNHSLDVIVTSGGLYSSEGIFFTVVNSGQNSMDENVSIIFLHHSTGQNIWNGGVVPWFTDYNTSQGTDYQITEQEFPKTTPYGWNNYPYDYWNIWVNHAGSEPYMEEPTLEILTQTYDVIVWKHCYPVSGIYEDTGSPDITSSAKRIENYQLQYEALKTKMHEYPNQRFIVWTGAALVEGSTNVEQATRAQTFFNWVRTEWDEPDDNIYLWDFWTLETGGGLYILEENAVSTSDSHPNSTFATEVAPYFAQRVVDVIEGRGDTGSITGN